MNQNFNSDERELIKLVNFFKKRAEKLVKEKELEEDFKNLIETCDKLVEQLNIHVKSRETILGEHEQLKKLVKDNAKCPKCFKDTLLKLIGTDSNEQGWKSNKYKCRHCNIEFVWNAPNNPWDMIPYVENFIIEIEKKTADESLDTATKQHNIEALVQMKANLEKLRPIVKASELDVAELKEREKEMGEMVLKVKKYLMIEKIKIDD